MALFIANYPYYRLLPHYVKAFTSLFCKIFNQNHIVIIYDLFNKKET